MLIVNIIKLEKESENSLFFMQKIKEWRNKYGNSR